LTTLIGIVYKAHLGPADPLHMRIGGGSRG
jgi:hypothetical protein